CDRRRAFDRGHRRRCRAGHADRGRRFGARDRRPGGHAVRGHRRAPGRQGPRALCPGKHAGRRAGPGAGPLPAAAIRRRPSPAPGVPADDWSAAATGTLTPPATGRYTFALTSDDGSRLYLDGKLVVDNWGDHARATKTGTVELTAGRPVAIRVEFYDQAREASVRLGWRRPGENRLLRQARLRQAVDLAADSDVAVVFAGDRLTEGMDQEDLSLPGNQNALIAAVARANPRTVVVLHTGAAVTMPWLDAVEGVIEAWYPGQESG